MNRLEKIGNTAVTVLWMAFIFYMSGRTGTASTGQSDFIVNRLMAVLHPFTGSMNPAELADFNDILTVVIRKCAHMTEYAILAILSYRTICSFTGKKSARPGRINIRYAMALAFTAMYAMTDEFHQSFVPERSGELLDVCIDTVGAYAGLVAYYVIGDGIRSIRRGKTLRERSVI